MNVSNSAGKTYDIEETKRLRASFKEQQDEMDKIDNEKSVQTTKIVQYAMVLTGVVLSLYYFNRLVNKKSNMKKILLFGGIGLAGFGLYRYFKYQVDMALNYDYKIKNFKVLGYDNDNINISVELEIVNNSSFEILVKEYDLKLFFKGKILQTQKRIFLLWFFLIIHLL